MLLCQNLAFVPFMRGGEGGRGAFFDMKEVIYETLRIVVYEGSAVRTRGFRIFQTRKARSRRRLVEMVVADR